MGLAEVRVAILSAMETVTAKVPSTIEAAALCKMADRGQITGAILDGPLALDNAISLERGSCQRGVPPGECLRPCSPIIRWRRARGP
jgi:phosphate acetyltransferase